MTKLSVFAIVSITLFLYITLNEVFKRVKGYVRNVFLKLPKHEIEKTLVLSTAHVTKDEMDFISGTEDPTVSPFFVYPYREGAIIHLGIPEEDDEKLAPHTPEFATIVKLARIHDCAYVKLDCDGPINPKLKTYNW